jgi:histone H3/H4
MAPLIAFNVWNPFLAGAVHGNSQALGDLSTIADEWQNFLSRRLKEDVALLQRLTRSTSPDQVLAAYADFWHKAAEDYGNEVTTVTKLMADMTGRIAVATQSATEDASTKLVPRKAA